MNNFTFIIPNYNGQEILKENLPEVLELAKNYDAPVIIGDDCSKDNSVAILENEFGFTSIIEGQQKPANTNNLLIKKSKNQGFSSNVNLCISYASTPLLLLLNTDATPEADAIDLLIPYFEDPLTLAVGMVDTDDNGELHGRGKFIFENGFLLHNKAPIETVENQKLTTGWVSCGSGMFSKQIWDQLTGLDPLFNPFYFEDVDLGYRAWKSGFKNYIEPQAKCLHLHKKGSIKSNYDEQRIKTISYRNQFIFTWKNLSDKEFIAQHLQNIPRQIYIAIKNKDFAFVKGMLEAAKQYQKLAERRKSQTIQRIMSDEDLCKLI